MAEETVQSITALTAKVQEGNESQLDTARNLREQKALIAQALNISKEQLKRTPTKAQQEEDKREAARTKKKAGMAGALSMAIPAGETEALSSGILGSFKKWQTGTVSNLKTSLAGIAGPALIAGGIALAVKNGIEGYLMAEDWGVSGASAALGGALGGTSSGWQGAFTNMGKWAAIGAGIGFPIVPPIGAIVGGVLGGALGGILGFIGGKKIAEGFDKIAEWFTGSLVPGVKGAWDALLPDWLKNINFEWSDILPKFIVDLYKGEADKPGYWSNVFSWKDLVPEFIWKVVTAAGEEGKQADGTFSWKALLPTWMTAAYDTSVQAVGTALEFDWRALLPTFIKQLFPSLDAKPLTIAAGLESIGAFDWRALLPKFIQDLFPSVFSKPLTLAAGLDAVGAFDWKSLLPVFLQEFIADPTQFANAEYKWEWKKLFPVFLQDFLDIGDKPQPEGAFTYRDLLPPFIGEIIDAGGRVAETVAAKFTWESLLPKFITDFIANPVPFDEAVNRFKWTDLVPTFITDILTPAVKDSVAQVPSFTWKDLVPQFIVDVIEGKGIFSSESGGFLPAFRKDMQNVFLKVYDSIADVVPILTSTAEASIAKLTEGGLFDKEYAGDSALNFKKISSSLASGNITQTDLVNLLKKEADDLSTADVNQLIQTFKLQDMLGGMSLTTGDDDVLTFDRAPNQQAAALSQAQAENEALRQQLAQVQAAAASVQVGGNQVINSNVQNIVETKVKYSSKEQTELQAKIGG